MQISMQILMQEKNAENRSVGCLIQQLPLRQSTAFNKLYYATIGGANRGHHIGTPHIGMVTLRMKF